MTETTDKPAEFGSDEQRDATVAALETEVAHLEQAAASVRLTDEQRAVKTRRAGEAAAELARIRGGAKATRLRGGAKEMR